MIKNVLNFFLAIIVILFFFIIFKYYSSNQNIENTDLNRENFEEILKKKTINLPILLSDTNDVVEFNSGFNEEIKNDKPRNFWELLKIK